MRRPTTPLALALLAGAALAPSAQAQSCGSGYDFDLLTGSDAPPFTPLDGQDGWTAESFNTAIPCGVTATLGPDGSPALRFEQVGPGVGCDASRLNDGTYAFPAFTGAEAAAFFQADFGVGFWGNDFGPAVDVDGNGQVRGSEPGERALRLKVGSNNSVAGVAVVSAAGNVTKVPLANAGGATGGSWLRLRLVMDLTANGGAGVGRVDYVNLSAGGTQWAAVPGLEAVDLELTPGSGDAGDPTAWHALWLHFEGATNQLDSIDVGPVACDAVGSSYCFGDGSGATCPCGNAGGASEGCANSTGSGARVLASGSASVATDSLGFQAAGLLPSQPALLFVGDNAINGGMGIPFGDGLRCAGQNVVRLGVQNPDGGGAASWGPGLNALGGWSPGDTRDFQVWYRDPSGSPCGSGFNLTNGIEVLFAP